jgi:hypothetical protein
MATAIASPQRLRADDIFSPALALLILGVVVLGFWQSYFVAGMVRATLPNSLVHIHGAAVRLLDLFPGNPDLVNCHG